MKQITAFVTGDGKLFEIESTAIKHEMFLSRQDEVEAFLESDLNHYKATPQKGIARSSVIGWELWKAENDK